METNKPFPNCHWIDQGTFLAGEYPRNLDESTSQLKIDSIVSAGIVSFIDLTEAGELKPYDSFLASDIRYRRFPIRDVSIPTSRGLVIQILDHIDVEIEQGRPVYLHCWGGRGRTGTIAGCWLSRHGSTGQAALDRLHGLWLNNPKSEFSDSPETEEQCAFVRNWTE